MSDWDAAYEQGVIARWEREVFSDSHWGGRSEPQSIHTPDGHYVPYYTAHLESSDQPASNSADFWGYLKPTSFGNYIRPAIESLPQLPNREFASTLNQAISRNIILHYKDVVAKSTVIRTVGFAAHSSAIEEVREKHGEEFVEQWQDLATDASDLERIAIDVQFLLKRLGRFYSAHRARRWLLSYNQRLGSRPIDAIAVRATPDAVAAADAEEQLSY